MKRTSLIAVFVGFATMAAISQDALARGRMYHPRLGRFMQRDPIGTSYAPPMTVSARPNITRNLSSPRFTHRDPAPEAQYADGMNTYQYVRSSPTDHVDPEGLRILISKKSPGTAQAVSAAIKKLCPCFVYEPARPGGDYEITVKTWKGEDEKGKEKEFPYDPKDKAAKEKFCKCYMPDKKAIEKLGNVHSQLMSLNNQGRITRAEEAAAVIQKIGGNTGRWASCQFVAAAIRSKRIIWIEATRAGDQATGRGILWNPTGLKFPGPAYIALGHELIHKVTGLGAEYDEFKVVGYENAMRWEAGVKLRLDYTGMPIAQYGDPLIKFPKIDRCECEFK